MASLAELAAQAAKKPYDLELPDGATVSVPQPSLSAWQSAPVNGGIDDFLAALGVGADDAARVSDALKAAPLGTADYLVSSMRKHFGLGN